MKAIIIDDENRSIDNLTKLLADYNPEVEIISTANNIDDGFTEITKYKPDVVFLDVDMPPHTGFDLLKKFDNIDFEVIFVTGYDYYAIDAIIYSALYYILKPIRVDDLRNAIEKAKKKLNQNNSITTDYVKSLDPKSQKLDRIVINSNKEKLLIEIREIEYVEADNAYSTFYLKSGKKVIDSQKSVKDYESLLSSNGFFRCHRSYLVNLSEIAQIDSRDGDEIVLKNNTRIPLARRRKADLKAIL